MNFIIPALQFVKLPQWTFHSSAPLSKTYHRKQQFLGEVINPLNQRLSKKIVPAVRHLYAEGDVVIALIDGKAIAKDGQAYNMSYAWFMTMQKGNCEGGRIPRRHPIRLCNEADPGGIRWHQRFGNNIDPNGNIAPATRRFCISIRR